MKKAFLFALMFAITLGVWAQEESKRYEIKSGIINLISTTGGHETEETQWFDDYGAMESLVFTTEIPGLVKYDTYTITKGDKAWFVNDTEGKKSTKAFDNPTPDLNFLNPTPNAIEKYKIEEIGEETFLDRLCKKFTYETSQGRKTCQWTVWVYKGITLKSIAKMGRREVIVEATVFQENVPVPTEVFEIPE